MFPLIRRFGLATVLFAIASILVTFTVFADFAYSSYTGPTIIQNNNNGTWNVQWTINVTTLNSNDNSVCLTTSTGQTVTCGATTGLLTCTANNVPNTSTVTWDISSYSGSCSGGSKKTQGPTGTVSPLAVQLAAFTAVAGRAHVDLAWETVSEQDNAGFNLYRARLASGVWTKLNLQIIPSAAPGSSEGHAYAWLDLTADPASAYAYRLEAVDLAGNAETVGMTRVTPEPAGGSLRLWLPRVGR